MTRFITALLAAAISISAMAGSVSFVSSDAQSARLKGPVRSVALYRLEEIHYFHADTLAKYKRLGKPLPRYEKTLDNISDFDTRGRLTRRHDAIMERTDTYDYDPAHPEWIQFTLNSTDGKYSSRRYSISRNPEGFPLRGEASDNDGPIFTEDYSITNRPDGNIQLICLHTNIRRPGSYSDTIVFRKDRSMLSMSMHTGLRLFFDEKERPSGAVLPESQGGKTLSMEYAPGRETTYTVLGDERILTKNVLTDRHGNPLKEISFAPDGSAGDITTCSYEYDSHGNWIRRTTQSSDGKERIEERVIEYYE